MNTQLILIFYFSFLPFLFSEETIYFGSGINKNGSTMKHFETDLSWVVEDLIYFESSKTRESYYPTVVTNLKSNRIKTADGIKLNFLRFHHNTFARKDYGSFFQPHIIEAPYVTPVLKEDVYNLIALRNVSSFSLKQCFCTNPGEKPRSLEFTAFADNIGEYFLNGEYIGSGQMTNHSFVPFEFSITADKLKSNNNSKVVL